MLPEQNAAGRSPAQIMMTLSAISYVDPTEIKSELADKTYATQGEWDLVWGPIYNIDSIYVDNLVYIVQLKGANMYTVVIRGTVLSNQLSTLLDLYEDLDVSCPLPWIYPAVPKALVAGGTLFGLEILTTMKDTMLGQTILQFLSSRPPAFIYVTGHSLGGCLTTVFAPWLKYQFELNKVKQGFVLPFTFAAPTAGNKEFALWYDQRFTLPCFRYFNTIDLIPMAWSTLHGIDGLFPPKPYCPWSVKELVYLLQKYLKECDVSYTQTNGQGTPLKGTSTENPDWFKEVEAQHKHNTYLRLLKAPPITETFLPIIKPKCHNILLMQPETPPHLS